MKRMDSFLHKLIRIIYVMILVVFCLFSCIHLPHYYMMFQHSVPHIFVGVVLIGGALFLWHSFFKRWMGQTDRFFFLYTVVCIWIVANALLVLKVATPIGWDSFELTQGAQFDFDNARYFATYPNNVFPTLLLTWWYKGLSFLPLSPYRCMLLLNLLLVYGSLFLTMGCARKLGGSLFVADVTFWFIVLIGCNPTLSVVYTDTMALPFPIGFLYCLLCLAEHHRRGEQYLVQEKEKRLLGYRRWLALCFYGTMAVLCIVMGVLIKPTVIIIMIATVILIAFSDKWMKWKKEEWMVIGICCILGLFGYIGIQNVTEPIRVTAQENAPEIRAKSPLHYIGMGLCEHEGETGGYGSFTESEVEWTNAHILDENYNEEAIERIISKVKAFGVGGLTEHLWHKLVWMGSDGTFAYGMEGGFHVEPQSSQTSLRGKLQNAFYTETELYQRWIGNILQAAWILFLLWGIFHTVHERNVQNGSHSFWKSMMQLTVLGIVLFLLIFENRSRYLFLYLPIFILANTAIGGWSSDEIAKE